MEDPNVWKAKYTPETKEMLKELSKVKPMILSSFPEVDMLGYKSPIEVIMSDMVMKEEDQVMQAVWNVGVNVDKAELVRALAYDRDQYAAGYRYAKEKFDRPHGEWIKCKAQNDVLALVLYQCSNCNTLNDGHPNFCPNCGASMSANDRQVTSKLGEEAKDYHAEYWNSIGEWKEGEQK